jgi:S1-C subfamily serine protease
MAIVKIILSGIFLALLLSGCTPQLRGGMDGRYDSSHIHVDGIDEVLDHVAKNVYRIETSTTFRIGDDISTLKAVGMAFSVDDKHLLTAKHVTSIDTYQVQTPFGLMSLPISPETKVEEKTALVFDDGSRVPVGVIYRDEALDFALLEVKTGVNPPVYSIGNSDDFRVANAIILPSNFQTGLNIRMGYVTQLDFVRYGQEGEVTEKYEHIFGISAVVSEGDSGSPVLFVRDGNLELGGVVSFIVLPARGLGYGLKINPIIERLKTQGGNQTWFPPHLESKKQR